MDRFDAMSVLIAAVESGSLSKASRRLGLPLATVSRKMADLEAHLKATLLVRSSRGLELTPAGRSYVTAAKSILEQVVEAERAAAGEYLKPKGDLVVTGPNMFGLMHVLPVVTSFLAAYPDVSVGLMLTDKVTHFLDDQIDVALRIGDLPDSELVAVRLGAVRRVICASPWYLSTRGTPAAPGELPEHSVVSFESVSSTSNWKFWSGGSDFDVSFRSRLSVNTIEAAIDAGLAGSGLIRTMSYQIAEHVRRGDLQIVLSEFEPPVRPVHLVYDKKNRLPLKLRAFIDFVVPRLRERIADAAL
ncbi:LysR family transcriptional regulator [Paraburkholderia fungorum]|uniref:LysR family transcriptional regulator n=1 Tax=Paraburkholderia fungorum TaxID=134537 RepID=UPI002097C9F0|nr:LysR family transcriptional regulator [Paraburkholderia fungorum]USX11263.1 LysR family transcriptional regulator [Paraburkholderia fungorum]